MCLELDSELNLLTAREQAHFEIFERNNLDRRFVQDPEGLERFMNTERDRLIELERALLTLEASQTVSKIASMEDHVTTLRQAAEAAASEMEVSEQAQTVAKTIGFEPSNKLLLVRVQHARCALPNRILGLNHLRLAEPFGGRVSGNSKPEAGLAH